MSYLLIFAVFVLVVVVVQQRRHIATLEEKLASRPVRSAIKKVEKKEAPLPLGKLVELALEAGAECDYYTVEGDNKVIFYGRRGVLSLSADGLTEVSAAKPVRGGKRQQPVQQPQYLDDGPPPLPSWDEGPPPLH